MLHSRLISTAILCLAHLSTGWCQGITLDHDFSDWSGAELELASDSESLNAHLVEVEVASDADRLYFRLLFDGIIALDEDAAPHNTRIAVDVDNNALTGVSFEGMTGADLIVNLASRTVITYVSGVASLVGLNDIGFRSSPTYGDVEHELCIKKSDVGLPDLGIIHWTVSNSSTAQIVADGGADHILSSTPVSTIAKPLTQAPGTDIRVAFWNMNGRFDQSAARAAMERLLVATQPDVIGFSEVSDVSAAYVAGWLDQWLPLDGGALWVVVKDDYDLMVASPWPVLQSFAEIDRQFPVLLDTEAQFGAPLLVTSSHLKCCGDSQGLRQQEADEYMGWLRDAMTPGGGFDLPIGSGVLYGGDLNMVGLGGAIRTLLTGDIFNNAGEGPDFAPDWNGGALVELAAVQTDQTMDYTWRNDNSEWAPGKLDYMIVGPSALNILADFSMETAHITAERLAEFGLQSGDDLQASDHFMICADLAFNADIGDLPDDDGDGVPNILDICPTVADLLQGDFNGDGVGDACQDSDGDGLSDYVELTLFGSNPALFDSNANGVDDASELLGGTANACLGDFNADGLVTVTDLMGMLGIFGMPCVE